MGGIAVQKPGPLTASLFRNFVPVVAFAIGSVQGHSIEAMELIGASLAIGSLAANNLLVRRALRGAAQPPGLLSSVRRT